MIVALREVIHLKCLSGYSDKDILKYRSLWMGAAIVWIILFHAEFVSSSALYRIIQGSGYGGVDIMFFASGLGCWYSFSKDEDVGGFLKRRALRILPMFYVLLPVWFLLKSFTTQLNPFMVIGNVFFVEYFANPDLSFNWYMSALWLFYFLTPCLCAIVKAAKKQWQTGLVLVLLVLISTAFWWSEKWVILVTRLPIFFLGLCYGKYAKDGGKPAFSGSRAVAKLIFLALGVACIYLFRRFFSEKLWSCGLYWYPFILITPGLCMLLSLLGMALDKSKAGRLLVRLLSFLGKHSFELYLSHIVVFEYCDLFLSRNGLERTNPIRLAAIAVSAGFAAVLYFASKGIQTLLTRKSEQKTRGNV